MKLPNDATEHLFTVSRKSSIIEIEKSYKREVFLELIKKHFSLDFKHKTLTIESPYHVASHPAELQRAPFFQTLYSGTQIQKLLLLTKFDFDDYYFYRKDSSAHLLPPQNLIFYGAPGTGKSYKIEYEILADIPEAQKERVSFHPEYDHASFVGSYQPLSDEEGNISYQFVPQAFSNIYVKAWQNPNKPYFLVVEEINRGNCAEIFGDIFQLLDRKSNYAITPQTNMQQYLIRELGKEHEGIKNGKMRLPTNLQLLATMNTSDQSLFPMDSAFKRRWDWKYMPINYNEDVSENASAAYWVALDDNQQFRWLDFIQKVNERYIKTNENLGEDKCIGNYFIKPDENIISLEAFINKAIFNLWIDVFQDEAITPFESGVTYNDFFPETINGKPLIEKMLKKLEITIHTIA